MSLFKRIKEKGLVRVKDNSNQIIAVTDIKEYLVKEYERANDLMLQNEGLKQELEKAGETEVKYNATLVTLDEYSKRLEFAENEIKKKERTIEQTKQDLRAERDKVNSYKIKFNNAAITKAEIEEEIVEEVKADIISKIRSCKGNLSKKAVCEIIAEYTKKNKGGVEWWMN